MTGPALGEAADRWTWPVRWDVAVRLAEATGVALSPVLRSPGLAAHRELDRLSALARAVHLGETDGAQRLCDALHRLRGAAPWLLETASEVETLAAERGCPRESEAAGATDGLLDDGAVGALLAAVATVAGAEAADLVLGLTTAALAAETALPGLVRGIDPTAERDREVLAARSVTMRPVVGEVGARGAGTTDGVPGAPMQTMSGSLGVPGGIPGLGNIPGGGLGGGIPGWPGSLPGQRKPKLDEDSPWFQFDPEILDHRPVRLFTPDVLDRRQFRRLACFLQLRRLLLEVEPPPPRNPPGSPVTWTTGIESTEVTLPCSPAGRLTIHGQGFGSTQPSGVGVVGPAWDPAKKSVVCRAMLVLGWSDTAVTVQLPLTAAGGVVGFADLAWIAAYDAWVERENARVRGILDAADCLGERPPAGLVIRQPWSECPAAIPAATFKAGMPYASAEIVPVNGPTRLWNGSPTWNPVVLLSCGEPFRFNWVAGNATKATLYEVGGSSDVFTAVGKPSMFDVATTGSELLHAPSVPGKIALNVSVYNECGGLGVYPLAVAVGAPLTDPTMEAVAPVPGGDVVAAVLNGEETLLLPTPRSTPLVAGKRTVLRIDWQAAVPQAPPGQTVHVRATAWAHVPAYPGGPVNVQLHPQADTSKPAPLPAAPPLELRPTRAFTSLIEYGLWQDANAGNAAVNPGTFNLVLPASLAIGDVTVTAYVQARSPGAGSGGDPLYYNSTVTTTLRFQKRRAVRIRFQRWSSATMAAASEETCRSALVRDGAMLPFPDPPVFALAPAPVMQNGRLVEDLFALKSATPGASGPEEIWFTMGNSGAGGVAPSSTPWTGATDPTRALSAHEIGHMFGQGHLNHPVCGPADGQALATFPDNGQVVVTGWDQWSNQEMRGSTDLMTYCFATAWMSPERWRRLFLKVGL